VRVPLRCRIPGARFEEGFERIRDEFDVRARFSDAALAEAAERVRSGPGTPPGFEGRVRDAADIGFVSIDPPGSTDLDQVFSAERREDGYRVWYAIADVAALVAPGGAIDAEARTRGLTLYSPDLRTSLHPVDINEGVGSLLAGEMRRALLWTLDLGADGEVITSRVERADIRNREQLSYRDVQNRVNGVHDDHPLALLREIGDLRTELETGRGAVSLQLPSQEVIEDEEGRFQLAYDESLPVETWNAQISLMTGMAASRMMIDAGLGLLRTLPPPDRKTVSQLRRTARALEIEWPDDVGYADRVRELRPDTPEAAALLAQSARALRGAGYVAFQDHEVPDQPEHSAIASTYAHVTAPLRRLCDRFANEIVVSVCADIEPPEWAVAGLDQMPSVMGRANQKDRAFEKAIVDFVEALVMETRIGERFTGVVTDMDQGRARIQLRTPAVVAHMEGRGLELGDEIEVEVKAADPVLRTIELTRA
jgi:exoribonuclease R